MEQYTDPPSIPAYICPLLIDSFDGKKITQTKVFALIDTGADISIISSEGARRLGLVTRELKNAFLHGFSRNSPPLPRVRTRLPVSITKGSDELLSNIDVADLPKNLNCQMIMGRDLITRFNMAFGPIPTVHADEQSRQNAKLKEANLDFFERRSLLSDFVLDPEKEKTREALRSRLSARLNKHMDKVPINGFIRHAQAIVNLTHDEGHATSYTPQYRFKNPTVNKTITQWVDKMD